MHFHPQIRLTYLSLLKCDNKCNLEKQNSPIYFKKAKMKVLEKSFFQKMWILVALLGCFFFAQRHLIYCMIFPFLAHWILDISGPLGALSRNLSYHRFPLLRSTSSSSLAREKKSDLQFQTGICMHSKIVFFCHDNLDSY